MITIYANFSSNQAIEWFLTLNDADRSQATKRRVTFHSLITVINVSYDFQFHVQFGSKCCRQELLVCHVSANLFGYQRAPLVVHPTLASRVFAVASRPYRPSNRVSNLVGFLASRRKLRQIGFELLELIKTTFTVIYGRDRPNLTLFLYSSFHSKRCSVTFGVGAKICTVEQLTDFTCLKMYPVPTYI